MPCDLDEDERSDVESTGVKFARTVTIPGEAAIAYMHLMAGVNVRMQTWIETLLLAGLDGHIPDGPWWAHLGIQSDDKGWKFRSSPCAGPRLPIIPSRQSSPTFQGQPAAWRSSISHTARRRGEAEEGWHGPDEDYVFDQLVEGQADGPKLPQGRHKDGEIARNIRQVSRPPLSWSRDTKETFEACMRAPSFGSPGCPGVSRSLGHLAPSRFTVFTL